MYKTSIGIYIFWQWTISRFIQDHPILKLAATNTSKNNDNAQKY